MAHGGHREGPDPNAVQRGSRFRKLQFVRVVTEDVILSYVDPPSVQDGETAAGTHRGPWDIHHDHIHASFESVRPAEVVLVSVTSWPIRSPPGHADGASVRSFPASSNLLVPPPRLCVYFLAARVGHVTTR